MTDKIVRLQKRSAEQMTADSLREGILTGDLPLGARLTELGSAQKLGVSRATVRTAFHQLVQEGILVQVC